MNTSTTIRPRIEQLLQNTSSLKNQIDQLKRGYEECRSQSSMADSYASSGRSALRQAERDTPNTDSSWHGRSAQRDLDQSDHSLTRVDGALGRLHSQSAQADRHFDANQETLRRLIQDCADNSVTLSHLRQADQEYSQAEQHHHGGAREGDQADRRGDQASRELSWAESYVRQVTSDRPGTDVSREARSAGSRVDSATWNIRDQSVGLRAAADSEANSAGELQSVEDSLRQALGSLPG